MLSSFYTGTRQAARLGEKRLIPVFFALYALCCGAIPFLRQISLLYMVQFIGGFSFASLLLLFMSGAVEGVPQEKRSTSMGFFQSVYGIGMTFGPALMGLLVQSMGIGSAYLVMAGLCATDGMVICCLIRKPAFLLE